MKKIPTFLEFLSESTTSHYNKKQIKKFLGNLVNNIKFEFDGIEPFPDSDLPIELQDKLILPIQILQREFNVNIEIKDRKILIDKKIKLRINKDDSNLILKELNDELNKKTRKRHFYSDYIDIFKLEKMI